MGEGVVARARRKYKHSEHQVDENALPAFELRLEKVPVFKISIVAIRLFLKL